MILQLIESSVICYLDGKEYLFDCGQQAYEQLGIGNCVKSVKVLNNQIIVELSHIDDDFHWKEEYKEQFGVEPSFFLKGGIVIKKLLIVGSGGHGRCCLDIARDMNLYEEIAFLDDGHVNEIINECQVIGTLDEMSSYYPEYTDIFIAVGNNKLRKKLSLHAKEIGYHLTSLISPDCYISRFVNIGDGIVVFPYAVIEANASISEGCIITSNVTIDHDAVIEDYCLIYSNTVIRSNAFIGPLSRIGSNCTITFGTKVKSNSDIKDGSVIEPSDEYSFEVGV